MLLPDVINACFEMFAGLFCFNHIRILVKDKKVRGVSILSTIFFTSWGFWNLYYYPYLEQWWSFYGGLFIVVANIIWVYLMIHYSREEKKRNENFGNRWNKR